MLNQQNPQIFTLIQNTRSENNKINPHSLTFRVIPMNFLLNLKID